MSREREHYQPRPPAIISAEATARRYEPIEPVVMSGAVAWKCEVSKDRYVILYWDRTKQHYFETAA